MLTLAALLLGGCATTLPEAAPVGDGPAATYAPPTVPPPPPPPPPSNPPSLAALSPVEAVRAAREWIDYRDPALHAVIALDPSAEAQAERSVQAPESPVRGKLILIKDNVEVAGLPTTAGSLALAANDTGRDAPLVARLRRAGMVIFGKTSLSEWANIRSTNSISGWSAVGGQTRNPYALDRNTCGSSSGSGAAVAAGYVDYAIGSETDGSITCPSSFNGVVGLKPTLGFVSRTHVVPISHSQDTAGPMTRTVRQAAELMNVIAGSDPADPATRDADLHRQDFTAGLTPDALRGQRVAVLRFATAPGTRDLFDAAVAKLRAAGAEVVEVKDFKPTGNFGDDEFKVLVTELKTDLNAYLASSPAALPGRTLADMIAFNKAQAASEMPLFGQEIFDMAEKTTGLSDPAYVKARANSLRIASTDLDRLLKDNKAVALVFPTYQAAWKIDVVNGDVSSGGGNVGSMAAVAGYPHLTVPMGLLRGLPVGLSFVGPRWSDGKLLALGNAYELARGPLPRPRFLPSIEEAPEIAPSLLRQSVRP
ncbi:amidase [Sphingomonas astaxanthinifaciens DSM 22298]|uniref:Amidase n=2 Tax=Sphingomonas TaxID=13687 RepID=A0ABQ5Z9W6_9SPHN|nr:amidase [Sphingomonas astaxanthinifaciens DSM 22298]